MTISTSKPFEAFTLYFLTVAVSSLGFLYALVFIDYFSKFTIIVTTKGPNHSHYSKTVLKPFGVTLWIPETDPVRGT